jgi:hypothetical protein
MINLLMTYNMFGEEQMVEDVHKGDNVIVKCQIDNDEKN